MMHKYALLVAVSLAFSCGSSEPETERTTTTDTKTTEKETTKEKPKALSADVQALQLTFTKDVNPVLTSTCAGSICHDQGSPFGHLVGNETQFNTLKDKIKTEIDNRKMPPSGSGKFLSSADKTTLLNYLVQLSQATANSTTSNTQTWQNGTGGTTQTGGKPAECATVYNAANKTTALALTFNGDINPVMIGSCSGSTCHSPGVPVRRIYVDNATNFSADAAGILYHLTRGSMPRAPKTIDATAKQKVYDFLCVDRS